MMNCPECRRVNLPERCYCGGCGAVLARYCCRCGFRNLTSDHFCGGCGANLESGVEKATASAAIPQERSPAPAGGAPQGDLAELLAAAREEVSVSEQDTGARVSQEDIDTLFGE